MIATQPPDGNKGRVERGAFYTPDNLALAIVRSLKENCLPEYPIRTIEPGCGGGAFLRAMHTVYPLTELIGVDTVPACSGPGMVKHRDIHTLNPSFEGADLIVGNPDFGQAEAIVRKCLSLLNQKGHLAFLLRMSFLGSISRVPLYREFPLKFFQPIAGRPSFTGGGSDTSEYGLFVWGHGHKDDGIILPPLEWK